MRVKLLLPVAVVAAVASLAGATIAPTANAAPQRTNAVSGLTQHLVGTSGNLAYDLTATVTKFVNQNGRLLATGTLTGTVTNTVTGLVTTLTNQAFSVPVTQLASNNTCTILDLTLGPLHLDLLGLVVDLNQVILDITAVSGAGNLLGNLLCAVVGLLDLPGAIAAITHILDNINNILSGLTTPGVGGVLWVAPQPVFRTWSA